MSRLTLRDLGVMRLVVLVLVVDAAAAGLLGPVIFYGLMGR